MGIKGIGFMDMNVSEKILAGLEKCYSLAPLGQGFLVASEKQYPCLLFDNNGQNIEQVWQGPGGTMSMVENPYFEQSFLATHRFYSPNDSKEASIVLCTKSGEEWKVKTLAKLPHVHRFDILQREGRYYLLACTLMERRDTKDDWSFPGKVYACELKKEHLDIRKPDCPKLEVIKQGLLKNHGYCRLEKNGLMHAAVSCDTGVYIFTPPTEGGAWQAEQILSEPVSDLIFADIDHDGQPEMAAIMGFHGNILRIYKMNKAGRYEVLYEYPQELALLHALAAGQVGEKTYIFAGNRGGEQKILALTWDNEHGAVVPQELVQNAGAANFLFWQDREHPVLLSANRECNEIVEYVLHEE